MRIHVSIFLLLFSCANLIAQQENLVIDPGFEDASKLSITNGQELHDVNLNGWTDPTVGTSDVYYYPSGHSGSSYPSPDSGKACAAFYASKNGENWAEYLQGTLTRPLVKNVIYHFSICLNIVHSYGTGKDEDINSVGVLFQETQGTNMAALAQGIPKKADCMLSTSQSISRDDGWVKYYSEYKALGGEKYLIIGSFQEVHGHFIHNNDYDNSSYIMADNVVLFGKEQELGPIPWEIFEADSTKTGMNDKLHHQTELDAVHPAKDESQLDIAFYSDLIVKEEEKLFGSRSV